MLIFAEEHQPLFDHSAPLSQQKVLERIHFVLNKILLADFSAKTNVSDTPGYCLANGCVELS